MAFNILIVDDSSIIRSMIERTIRMAGVPVGEILVAANGELGLELLGSNWVDLVLADVNMPVMDGVTMLEHMSGDTMMSNIPVVVVSTEGSETKIDKMRHCGMKAFVRKPFTPEAIRCVIQDILGEWEDENSGDSPDSF